MRTNPHRYSTIAGGTPALQTSQRPLQRSRLVGDRTNPHRYTTIAGGTPALQTSQRPLSRPRLVADTGSPSCGRDALTTVAGRFLWGRLPACPSDTCRLGERYNEVRNLPMQPCDAAMSQSCDVRCDLGGLCGANLRCCDGSAPLLRFAMTRCPRGSNPPMVGAILPGRRAR